MIFLPESPRYLMHKGKTLEAYETWKRIRGVNTPESRAEFYIMTQRVKQENEEQLARKSSGRPVWMDFY